MSFFDIIGHKDLVQSLEGALAGNRTGHAYLFLGPEGIGKKTLARAFAAGLLCLNGTADSDCQCPSCERFKSGNHPDFIIVSASGGSIKIEQLRELQRSAYFKPLLSRRRVFFFPEAEQLTEAAANSFLKILEEPPAGVVFLFTAVRADYILPTIRSRCQNYQLFPVAASEIAGWLIRQGMEAERAEVLSVNCEGIPGRALVSAPERIPEGPRIAALLATDPLQRLVAIGQLEKKERKDALQLLGSWEEQLRNELLQGIALGEADAVRAGRVIILEKLAETVRMVESNVNLRLALENFFAGI